MQFFGTCGNFSSIFKLVLAVTPDLCSIVTHCIYTAYATSILICKAPRKTLKIHESGVTSTCDSTVQKLLIQSRPSRVQQSEYVYWPTVSTRMLKIAKKMICYSQWCSPRDQSLGLEAPRGQKIKSWSWSWDPESLSWSWSWGKSWSWSWCWQKVLRIFKTFMGLTNSWY